MGKLLDFNKSKESLQNEDSLYTEIKENNIDFSLTKEEVDLLTPLIKEELCSIRISLNNAQKSNDRSSALFWAKMRKTFLSLNKKISDMHSLEFIELDAILGIVELKLQELKFNLLMDDEIDRHYTKEICCFYDRLRPLHKSITNK